MTTADFHLSIRRTMIPPYHYHRIGGTKLQALHTRLSKHYSKTAFGTVLQRKSEGTAFASSSKHYIPCIIGGDREPSRATIDVHSLPNFSLPLSRRKACSPLGLFLLFLTSTDLYGVFFFYPYMHLFWRQGIGRKQCRRKEKLDVRFLGIASFAQALWCVLLDGAQLMVPVEFG
jgi:hypothetical protein